MGRKIFLTIISPLIIIQIFAAQADTLLIHAVGAMNEKKYEQAWHLFSQSSDNNPELLPQKIEAAWHTGNYAEMKQLMTKLRYSQKALRFFYMSKLYARTGKNDSAFIMLEKLLENRNKLPRSQVKTDTVLARLKTDERWANIWKKEHYKPYDLKVEMAARELEVKNYDLALTLLDELIEDRPYREKPWYLRSLLFYRRGVVRSALSDINQAIKEDDDVADFYALKAKILRKLGREKKAFKVAQKAIKINPFNPDYHGIAAQAALSKELYDDGFPFAENYLAGYPEKPEALFIYAQFVYRNGSCMKALPPINKAIKKQSRNPEYYFLRAQIYQKCKVYAQAAKDYSMCLDFWPQNHKIYLGRGICRYHTGNKRGSCRDLERAFDLGAFEAEKMIRDWCR